MVCKEAFGVRVDVLPQASIEEVAARLDARTLAIVSVSPEIRYPDEPNQRQGGHLVLLHGRDAGGVWFHNPRRASAAAGGRLSAVRDDDAVLRRTRDDAQLAGRSGGKPLPIRPVFCSTVRIDICDTGPDMKKTQALLAASLVALSTVGAAHAATHDEQAKACRGDAMHFARRDSGQGEDHGVHEAARRRTGVPPCRAMFKGGKKSGDSDGSRPRRNKIRFERNRRATRGEARRASARHAVMRCARRPRRRIGYSDCDHLPAHDPSDHADFRRRRDRAAHTTPRSSTR